MIYTWHMPVIIAIQLGYSHLLKHYTVVNNKFIPVINLVTASAYFVVKCLAADMPIIQAIYAGTAQGLLVMIATTGAHSAFKNLIEAKKVPKQ